MSRPPAQQKFIASRRLFERAVKVVPGGIYGHVSPATLVPGEFPYYAARAEGCRYWDVDGNEFIDFMCSYGPVVLGHNHPGVEEAAARQRRDGHCFNHPTERMVELAEFLVAEVDFAAWAVFGKNGSDMTTWAVQVAREHTGRKGILKIRGAYHGSHAWCSPGHGGIIEEDVAHVHSFGWNNLEEFFDLLRTHADSIAAVVLTPFHHPTFANQEMPAHGFLAAIEQACRERGIVIILDDVRAGFRLHLGGSHRVFGFTPDIICFCKAIGNGYPISSALGSADLRKAASNVFLTGSYWNSGVEMAAALACLKALKAENALQAMFQRGEQLCAGLIERGLKYGIQVVPSGPPAIPFVTFAGDPNFRKMQRFAAEAAQRGVFFHPHHNWFVCAAHGEADIDEALGVAEECFAQVADDR